MLPPRMQALSPKLPFEVDERENGPADLSDPQAQWPKVSPASTGPAVASEVVLIHMRGRVKIRGLALLHGR